MVDHTFQVAFQGGHRRDVDYDRCTVSCRRLVNGAPSGADIVLEAPGTTVVEMEQWHPGLFRYTTSNAPLTRGQRYRATYTAYLGGAAVATKTQDFYAYSDNRTHSRTRVHRYTTLECRNIVRRALGLREATATVDGQEPGSANSLDIVNDALQRLWNEHPWQFTFADPWYFDLVEDQARIQLPDDFMECIQVRRPNDMLYRWVQKSWEWIRTMRERASSVPPNVTFYAIVSDPPDTEADRTVYAMEIWPTPRGYVQAGGVMDYRRECPRVCHDSDIPPFPQGYFPLVKSALRREAFEQENDPKAVDEAAKYARDLAAAKKHDGRHMRMNLGSMVRSTCPPNPDADLDDYHNPMYQIPD